MSPLRNKTLKANIEDYKPSIIITLALQMVLLSSVWANQTIYRDMQELDASTVTGKPLSEDSKELAPILGLDVKQRGIYHAYLKKAMAIETELLALRERMNAQDRIFSLQELGALTQRVIGLNNAFDDDFTHGETGFETYRLIERAVHAFEDAVDYWRIANKARHFERNYAGARTEDDEVVKQRVEEGLNAVDSLKLLLDAQKALDEDFKHVNEEMP